MSELQRTGVVVTSGWTLWMLLCFLDTGVLSLVEVHQPPVVTAALGQDAILPCWLQISRDEVFETQPVLYWMYLKQNSTPPPRVWIPSGGYMGRVDLLDNPDSTNKSIILRKVEWADSGKYLCKLSITSKKEGSFRRKGNETSLMIYGTVLFGVTNHNESLLRCEATVTRGVGFALAVFHQGCRLETVDSAPGASSGTFVTLSETFSLRGGGKYECQLRLNRDVITRSIFHSNLPGDDGQRNASGTSSSGAGTPLYPEPWFLYTALLLVPVAFMVGVFTATLLRR
ncbi:uncharacterized protein LOC125015758 [Mugil cephalus]|uniref:uncharacterized protein LOC125015758 n=1 Tax=Mugil cephalus TaxID=48193 RepID=UPI001FB7F1A3|nr:uncharacterized protein LOC125015758 [Mugil cephalus]